jgi:hypothetical protein
MSNLVTIAQALRKTATEPDYQNLPNERGFSYPGAGRGTPPQVREAIEEFHALPDTAKRDLPLLWYLLGDDGTPQYKMSKSDSKYTDQSSHDVKCENCSFAYTRVVPGVLICSQVRGELQAAGWCRLWEPYPATQKEAVLLSGRMAAARSGLRLLLAEGIPTYNPRVLRRIQKKVDANEPLSPKEKRVLLRLKESNEARRMPAESREKELKALRVDIEEFKNMREHKKLLERSIDLLEEKKGGDKGGPGARLWRKLRRKLFRLDDKLVKKQEKLKLVNVPAKIRDALDKAGVERKDMTEEEHDSIESEMKEKDPLSSSKPFKKATGSVIKFSTQIKGMRRGIPQAMKEYARTSDWNRRSVETVYPLVWELLSPLDKVETRIEQINKHLEVLDQAALAASNKSWYKQVFEKLKGLISDVETIFRELGREINESLGGAYNKHMKAASNLENTLNRLNRFLEDTGRPDTRGTAEKLTLQIRAMHGISEGIKFAVDEFVGRYREGMKALKKLKADIPAMEELTLERVARVITGLARVSASLSAKKAPSYHRISKRLRKVSKRIVLLRYLSTTS